ncbi:MAG: YfhO family protein [Bacteroidetes bacterium]|nr:YfhO family protein [Bacteroidota bacterium]
MKLLQNMQQHRIRYQHYLLLLCICLLAFWPLSLGIFSVKNDAIHYFLPYRFHISEALRNGEWPFWSPYIYNGNPIMGDMQSGAWNPFVWIFSLAGRYDITLFHIENLLYIFLGGIGMYKLTARLTEHATTSLLIATGYMLSGFMLGGQLINWLAAAAFLPFVLHYYLLVLKQPTLSGSIKTGIALYLLFTAGYPSFFILTGYLMVLLFVVHIIQLVKQQAQYNNALKGLILQQVVIVTVFAALSLPALLAYTDLLPHYARGAGTSYAAAASNAFDPRYFMTALLPATIKSNDLVTATDITCRNIYVGLLPLLLLIAVPPRFNRRTVLLSLLAVFAAFFSMGNLTPVRELCYRFIPLLDTFRHPSQMRLYLILAVLLLTAPSVKRLLDQSLTPVELKRLKVSIWVTTGMLVLAVAFSFSRSSFSGKMLQAGSIRDTIKTFIESVSLADALVLNSLIQLLFLGVLLVWFGKWTKQAKFASFIWIMNQVLMAQLVLPASFVSRVSPAMINANIHASPKGFPVNTTSGSLQENSRDLFSQYAISGIQSFYNKKPGISKVTNSPAFLTQMDQFVQTDKLYAYVASQPMIYLADTIIGLKDTAYLHSDPGCHAAVIDNVVWHSGCSNSDKATLLSMGANTIEIETNTMDSACLVLTQNQYPHWNATIDGKPVTIYNTNISFMSVFVPAGKHQVKFSFEPRMIQKSMYVSGLTMLLIAMILIRQRYRQKSKKA